jgi:hypothetical protein
MMMMMMMGDDADLMLFLEHTHHETSGRIPYSVWVRCFTCSIYWPATRNFLDRQAGESRQIFMTEHVRFWEGITGIFTTTDGQTTPLRPSLTTARGLTPKFSSTSFPIPS